VVFVLHEPPPITEPVKPLEPIKAEAPKPAAAKAAPSLATTVIPTTVTEDEKKAIDPPKTTDIEGLVIDSKISDGIKGSDNINPGDATTPGGTGSGTGTGTDETIYNTAGLSEMPEPVGGAQAWTKFLQKNLRYPAMAQDEGVSGRVLLSFIIEKDGSLSNITVDRKAGFGFDEEALRVLKKATAWKPGMQNGRAVRVKYSIPINFRLPE
jgi:protein TonB